MNEDNRVYRSEWPTNEELASIKRAMCPEDMRSFWNLVNESISKIAQEMTDDPHSFGESAGGSVARQIGDTTDFKILREEIQDAAQNSLDIQRALHVPVKIGGNDVMVYFLVEAKRSHIYVDVVGCPKEIAEDAIAKLSKMMVN